MGPPVPGKIRKTFKRSLFAGNPEDEEDGGSMVGVEVDVEVGLLVGVSLGMRVAVSVAVGVMVGGNSVGGNVGLGKVAVKVAVGGGLVLVGVASVWDPGELPEQLTSSRILNANRNVYNQAPRKLHILYSSMISVYIAVNILMG